MCGIVAMLGTDGRALESGILTMSRAVAHRGPDDDGTWFDLDAGVGLGHRRLSVIDLSPAGHQPMVSRDGRWVLVFNGEIYDAADHRTTLETKGVSFRGHSDTEVLLELVARDGVAAAVSAVDGMFALAVWDRRDRTLTLARDRLGEKPLYYGKSGGTALVAASELSAIRRLPQTSSETDQHALAEYLRLGFVPAPLSIISGIRKLLPGSTVTLHPGGTIGEPTPYWSLEEVAAAGLADPLDASDTELTDTFETTLTTSVERRLFADVPTGVFLSGGLDSSTVAALSQSVSPIPLRTFTVAVGGTHDESDAAASVARHLGTEHTTIPVEDVDPVEAANHIPAIYDEPFGDPSAIPTAILCAATRQHVTVALSGDGADELFGGYNRYRIADGGLARALRAPRPLRTAVGRAAEAIPEPVWDAVGNVLPSSVPNLATKVHKTGAFLAAADPMTAFDSLVTQWVPATVMVAPPKLGSRRSVTAPPGAGLLEQMLLHDQVLTLPDNMLVKVDRASMAVALEVRVPFLDHRIAELSWRMPERAKVRDGVGKWLVREVLARHVPRELWDRPKMGFDPPLSTWLRGDLRGWAHDLLSPRRLRAQGLLQPEPIATVLAKHDSRQRNNDYALWTILMLQAWLETTKE